MAHLHQERFWMPDSVAKVKLADKQYLGVWLNGTEEWTACWYLKEGTPCFVVQEILPPKHAQLTAQETMIDFSAGTSSSSTHWNVNEYDARVITCGDLTLSSTTRTFDPDGYGLPFKPIGTPMAVGLCLIFWTNAVFPMTQGVPIPTWFYAGHSGVSFYCISIALYIFS